MGPRGTLPPGTRRIPDSRRSTGGAAQLFASGAKASVCQHHVLLCWLSLLLIRIAENGTGRTWRRLRRELDKMHLGRFSGRAGLVEQRTETIAAQHTIFGALALDEPPRYFHLEAADPTESA